MSILSLKGLTKTFGALMALNDVTFDVNEKEILGIIGPNGAGKTTLFNSIVGIHRPDHGDVVFRGRSLKNLMPHQICRIGITKTSQIVHPFLTLTVKENILVAMMFGQNLGKKVAEKKADEVMEFLNITDVRDLHSATISLPKRRKLELARALGTGAEIILMDENLAGLKPGGTRRRHGDYQGTEEARQDACHRGAYHEGHHGCLRTDDCAELR